MPTYLYKCVDCQSEFEAIASFQRKKATGNPNSRAVAGSTLSRVFAMLPGGFVHNLHLPPPVQQHVVPDREVIDEANTRYK